MKKVLIGYTGLVGQALCEQEKYDLLFNTKNINLFNELVNDGDELTLTCLPATKWLVNKDVVGDMNNIRTIIDIISKKIYSKVILISTIDVYGNSPLYVDETYMPNIKELNYGSNRYLFELMVKEYVKTNNLKIFRLPALFHNNIKKNVLFDLLNNNNVESINVNSMYQWYNLNHLHVDISKYSEYFPSRQLFNFFTEPIHTSFIVNLFPQYRDLIKLNENNIVHYDYRTTLYSDGYLSNKKSVITDIKKFIDEYRNK
jgi:hypothetical protein